MSKGKYGEPWSSYRTAVYYEGEKVISNRAATFGGKTDAARAVACVNALDGYDPEKVAALLAMLGDLTFCVKEAKQKADRQGREIGAGPLLRILSALAPEAP